MGTSTHVELRPMERAGEYRAAHPALRQPGIAVRAVVSDRVKFARDPTNNHTVVAKLREGSRLPVSQVAEVSKLHDILGHWIERRRERIDLTGIELTVGSAVRNT